MPVRLLIAAIVLLAGCSSTSEEVHRRCATAADPAACQRAEAARLRQADGARLDENSRKYGGY
jgi:uncharacterized lipoprotein YmbA